MVDMDLRIGLQLLDFGLCEVFQWLVHSLLLLCPGLLCEMFQSLVLPLLRLWLFCFYFQVHRLELEGKRHSLHDSYEMELS